MQRIEPERGGWAHFYGMLERCIRGEGAPPVPVTEALAGLAILGAARESAHTGRLVHLTESPTAAIRDKNPEGFNYPDPDGRPG